MAYEYEEYIKNVIGTEAVFSHEKEKRQERVIELQEVYRKAKAMDEILNIDLAQHDEEYAENVMKVVNKFTEGKQNENI